MTPRITHMTFSSTPARRQPKAGDLRVTKKHGKQIRVRERNSSGMLVSTNGRPWFRWASYKEALEMSERIYIPKEEFCNICKRLMDDGTKASANCGGDCAMCMAQAGDPAFKHLLP